MNRGDFNAILDDLNDVFMRAKDAGASESSLQHLERAAFGIWTDANRAEPKTSPRLFESNQPARNRATEAFRNSRKISKDVR